MQYLETNFPTRNKSIKTDLSLEQKLKKGKKGEKKTETNPNQQNTKPSNLPANPTSTKGIISKY